MPRPPTPLSLAPTHSNPVPDVHSSLSQTTTQKDIAISTLPSCFDVVIVGAGPSGCLLALLLASSSRSVLLLDHRSDPRSSPSSSTPASRSINLALSTRALTALAVAGLDKKITASAVPMHGRCVHPRQGQPGYQRYGVDGQFLLSLSRNRLSRMLVEECDHTKGITLAFGKRCLGVALDEGVVMLESGEQIKGQLVVGADGVHSKVRAAMMRGARMDFEQKYISAVYKELSMDVTVEDGVLEKEWLHIWPRHRFMLIALPNEGSGFTCTLFMDKDQIETLQTKQQIKHFFNTEFPDAVQVMPNLVDDFQNAPAPPLVTVRCAPYNYKDKAVVIGDAAHAIVPFYGQGCNAAFEDCRLLADKIREHGWENMARALKDYSRGRQIHANAIADLAIDQYEDMSSRSAKPWFVLKRRMEIMLNRLFPNSFLPLYTMISFSNVPYADAIKRAQAQDKLLGGIISTLGIATVCTFATLASRPHWGRIGDSLFKK